MEQLQTRLYMVNLLRHEVLLAYTKVQGYEGTSLWAHYLWHAFQPFFGNGDFITWVSQLRRLQLLMLQRPESREWRILSERLSPVVTLLGEMEPNPTALCSLCYP